MVDSGYETRPIPPVTRTLPSSMSTARWFSRADGIGSVAVQSPVPGSKISAVSPGGVV